MTMASTRELTALFIWVYSITAASTEGEPASAAASCAQKPVEIPGGSLLQRTSRDEDAAVGREKAFELKKAFTGIEPDTDLLGDALEPTEKGHGVKKEVRKAVHDKEREQHHTAHWHRQVILLFLFGVLIIGGLMQLTIERFLPSVPYTCALFVAGVIVSFAHAKSEIHAWYRWSLWFDSVEAWQSIDPHVLFHAFLPPLLFGEAMRVNVHLVSQCFAQVAILACPGVLLGTVMTASLAKYLLPYQWDWPICAVFGSILSATDPVAVVALLNTLGVSERLTMIVSGESLLNDGTAIVIFQLTLKWLQGGAVSSYAIGKSLCVLIVPAILGGALISLSLLTIIGACAEARGHSDAMIQVIVTIACGYLAFFLAEEQLLASGVLATVSSGFVIAYYAWPRFVSRETVHIVWEAIEFVGNTVIFFLSGVIFMNTVLERLSLINQADVLLLLMLYVGLTMIRAIMISVLWIPLNLVGTRFQLSEGIVMVHSGLRGAVSLTLAIIVDLEPAVSKQMGTRVMFHVGGIAALTFLINASTAAPLLRYLGLTSKSAVKKRMLSHVAQELVQQTTASFEKQMTQPEGIRFNGINPLIVRSMVPALHESAGDLGKEALTGHLSSFDSNSIATDAVSELEGEEAARYALAQEYRELFLRVVQKHYWEAIQDGVIPRNLRVARILLHSTEKAKDNIGSQLNDWEIVCQSFDADAVPTRLSSMLSWLASRRPMCWSQQFRRSFAEEFRTLLQVWISLSFQEAHSHAQAEIPKYFAAKGDLEVQVRDAVMQESRDQCMHASRLLLHIDAQSIELAKSEMLARRLLRQQLLAVESLRDKGLLTDSEASSLSHETLDALHDLTFSPKSVWLSKRGLDVDASDNRQPRLTITRENSPR